MNNRLPVISSLELRPAVRQMLTANGFDVIASGSLDVTYHLDELTQAKIKAIKGAVVITSSRSVEAISRITNNRLDAWTELFCLSGETQKAALVLNLPIRATAINASSLAKEIVKAGVKSVTFITSTSHRPEIPDLLRENGIQVEILKLYSTTITSGKIAQSFDYALFFSPGSAKAFLEKNRLDQKVICFSIGETTGKFLRGKIKNNIVTALFPSQEHLAETLINHIRLNEPKLVPTL